MVMLDDKPLWKTVWGFLHKLNIYLLCDTATGIYSREMKTHAHNKPLHECLQKPYLQEPRTGNNLDALQQVDDYTNGYTHTMKHR